MITLETLFAKGYVPKRTIVLGFGAHNLLRKMEGKSLTLISGNDEETGGKVVCDCFSISH